MTRLGICAVVCAIFVQGCGGGSSVSLDQFKDQDINTLCDRLVRCGVVSDKAFCVAVYQQLYNDANLKAGVANGSISYDPNLAGQCLDTLDGASCDPSSMDSRVEPQACKDAVKGNRHPGDACYFDLQCSSDTCNITNPNCGMACCAGMCGPDPAAPAAIGSSCAMTTCVDGAYCDATQKCAALLAIGMSCQSNNECAYGSVCAGATTPVCTATPKAGDPCINQFGTNTCVADGLLCDATTHCVGLLDKGATCDPQNSACKGDLACDPTTMKCTVFPSDGQPCTTGCQPPDTCVINGTAGTCTPPQANGAACQNSRQCTSGFCDPTTNMCATATVCS
jgi:hypothetical protein